MREASALRAIVLVPLLLVGPFAPALAAHENVVLLDAVAPADELTKLTFTVPVYTSFATLRVECGGDGVFAFRQSNVEGDPFWEGICASLSQSGEWELPHMAPGAEYSVTVRTSGPTRVVAVAHEFFPERYNDARPHHAFHFFSYFASGIGAWPVLSGSFTPAFDLTDVVLEVDNGAAAVFQTEPTYAFVGPQPDGSMPDLEAGATYAVVMSLANMCQPQCFAQVEVDVRGVPATEAS